MGEAFYSCGGFFNIEFYHLFQDILCIFTKCGKEIADNGKIYNH